MNGDKIMYTKLQLKAMNRIIENKMSVYKVAFKFKNGSLCITDGYKLFVIEDKIEFDDNKISKDDTDRILNALNNIKEQNKKSGFKVELPTIKELKEWEKENIKTKRDVITKPYPLEVTNSNEEYNIYFNINYLIDCLVLTKAQYGYVDVEKKYLAGLFFKEKNINGVLLPVKFKKNDFRKLYYEMLIKNSKK